MRFRPIFAQKPGRDKKIDQPKFLYSHWFINYRSIKFVYGGNILRLIIIECLDLQIDVYVCPYGKEFQCLKCIKNWYLTRINS